MIESVPSGLANTTASDVKKRNYEKNQPLNRDHCSSFWTCYPDNGTCRFHNSRENVVTNPREVFVTIGSALTGPVGAILIGFFAEIAEPGGITVASLLAHIVGSLWMAFSYKSLVYESLEMPKRLLGWIALILVYYGLLISGFVAGLIIFYGEKDLIGPFAALVKEAAQRPCIAWLFGSIQFVG